MPAGRILLKSISLSYKLPQLSCDSARLLYTWGLAHLDVEGVIHGDPGVLNNLVFTRLRRTAAVMDRYLVEMETVGLIVRFKHGQEDFILYPDFVEKQPHLRPDHEAPPLVPVTVTTKLRRSYNQATTQSNISSSILPQGNYTITSQSDRKLPAGNFPTVRHDKPSPIWYDFEERKWQNILTVDWEQWAKTYPACNIEAELNKMATWLLANPKKAKKDYKRFIVNWLTRAQDKGGTKGMGTSGKEWAASKGGGHD